MNKPILDACCGGKSFWFNKNNPNVLFADIREGFYTLCDGRNFEVKPDIIMDFRNMPFPAQSFKLVVFDPPHLEYLGENSYMAKKYGILNTTWQSDLKQGFMECMRVLEIGGTLIFKWNETQIKVSELLKLFPVDPLFGQKRLGKSHDTHWLVFMKL